MASMVLLGSTHPESSRVQKILVTAAYCNVDVRLNKEFDLMRDTNNKEYLLNCHPLGRIPSLQTPDGYLFESNAICRYLARVSSSSSSSFNSVVGRNMYGRTSYEAGQVDQWLDFASTEIEPILTPYLHHYYRGAEVSAAVEKEVLGKIDEVCGGLEAWLETRTYLVGERITIADICVVFSLQMMYRFVHPVSLTEGIVRKYRNVWRLYNTVMQQPITVGVLKETGGTFGLPAKPKGGVVAVEKKKTAAAGEEKKGSKKKAEEEEEEEEHAHEEKKKPNPLDLLPPSPLVLDTWKKMYSNNDTRTVAAPWFFENFDPVGYTCYWASYKYNEENKKVFMTGNLVGGWFQRMEGCRKYCFGVALIIGTEAAHEITSFWMIRGKGGLPECVKNVEDTELFDWIEIKDVKAERDKITDYLCWEGPTIPKPVLEGRTFK